MFICCCCGGGGGGFFFQNHCAWFDDISVIITVIIICHVQHLKDLYKLCQGKIAIPQKLYEKYLNLQPSVPLLILVVACFIVYVFCCWCLVVLCLLLRV